MLLALYHDAPEILTGDLPTPVKYFSPEISAAYKAVERAAGESLAALLPPDLLPDYRPYLLPGEDLGPYLPFLKGADRLSALVKCMEEVRQGNDEFRLAERQTRQAISEMGLPELDEFMAEFIPAFTRTLDELQEETPL